MEKKLKLHEGPILEDIIQPFLLPKQEAQVWSTLKGLQRQGRWGNSVPLGLRQRQWYAGNLALQKIKSADLQHLLNF